MLRELQTFGQKPIKATYVASENMTQGMAVSIDHANEEVDKATGVGEYLVDVPKNYDGANAYLPPDDDACEAILDGDTVLVVPTLPGERYATDQLTIGTLSKGDYLKAASGLFVAAAQSDATGWIYGGTYSDPTGTLYVIERIVTTTMP